MLVVESAAGDGEGVGTLGRRGLAFAPVFDFGRVDFDFGRVDFGFGVLLAFGRGDLVRFTDFVLAGLRFVVLATLSLLVRLGRVTRPSAL
jgi:hypothetical protein